MVKDRTHIPYSHRLVDYLAVCGLGDVLEPMEPSVKINQFTDVTTVPLKPSLLDRYPLTDWRDYPITPFVSSFCFPQGVITVSSPPLPSLFTFVMTEALGAKIYGTCLVFYEPLPQTKLLNMTEPTTEQQSDEEKPSALPNSPSPSPPSSPNLSSTNHKFSNEIAINLIRGPSFRRQSFVSFSNEKKIHEPKCICLLSHHPFYHGFKQFLCELYRISCSEQTTPLERIVCNLFEVPLPPLGRIKVHLSMANKLLTFTRPPPNALPMADFPMEYLFYCLDIDNILTLMTCVLLERKMVFISRIPALLTCTIESILALVFPFHWQGGYVPLLPVPLLDFVNAPVPFIMGVIRDCINPAVLDSEVICIDLDNNTISGGSESLPELPRKEWTKLRKAMEVFANVFNPSHPSLESANDAFQHAPPPAVIDEFITEQMLSEQASLSVTDADAPPLTEHDFEGGRLYRKQLRASFLRFFVALLHKYRKCLDLSQLKLQSAVSSDSAFDKKAFMEDFTKTDKPFMAELMATQLWSVFINERLEYHKCLLQKQSTNANQFLECRFFDECIDAKENRSKLHVYKKGTPFLSMNRYAATEDYNVPAPDTTGLDPETRFRYPRFPALRPEYFTNREIFAEVLEEQDIRNGMSSRMHMAVTMAALIKGREFSLFQSNVTKDAAVIQLLQNELDSHRTELSAMSSQLEQKDAESRSKDIKIQSYELETAALRLELAQLKQRFPAAQKGQSSRTRPSMAESMKAGFMNMSNSHANNVSALVSGAQSLEDPPTLLLSNLVVSSMETLELALKNTLETYGQRLNILSRHVKTLKLRYEQHVTVNRAEARVVRRNTMAIGAELPR
eukprot:c7611_g1_i2.p1 GENE.c7611_g1_i2~~c7611_g1_i2.p1  ORF type:complete len:847 (+),score=174.92 c7611_g1_i2:30-2570(+)